MFQHLLPLILLAQVSTTGNIAGTVTGPDGNAVANAEVVLAGPRGDVRTTTSTKGTYRFEFVPPGDYDVRIHADGLQPSVHTNVTVRLDSRTTLDSALRPAAELEETIVVTGEAPTVDTSSSTASTIISGDFVETIPRKRAFSDVVTLAPGVVDGGGTGEGNPSISGSSGLENTYVVDGVNITNTGYGSIGSYSTTYGSLGTGVNFDFVDTVQVQTAGFEAEHGQALGGVVNVVTRRGTNEMEGSVFGYVSPRFLESSRRQVYLFNGRATETGSQAVDLGFHLSGPILQDKLFFFAALNPQQRQVFREAPTGFPLASVGEETTTQNRTSYAGKLTWNAAAGHMLEVSLFGDPGVSEFGPQGGVDLLRTDTGGYSRLDFGGHNQVLRYHGLIGGSTSVQAQVARAANVFSQSVASEAQGEIIDYRPLTSGEPVLVSGGAGHLQDFAGENRQYQVKLTHYTEAIGRHELKVGASYEDVRFTSLRKITGPRLTVDTSAGPQTTTTGSVVFVDFADDGVTPIYRAMGGSLSPTTVATRSDYISLFVQDKWSPVEAVTIDVGLRVEQQRIVGTELEYTFKFLDNIAPRLGLTWDFTGRGRGKLYARYGRFFEKIPNDIAVRQLSLENQVFFADFYDPELTQPIADGDVPYGSYGSLHRFIYEAGTSVEEGTKSQFQDEVIVGGEYEAMPRLNLGLRYIHREVGRVVEDYQFQSADGILAGDEIFIGFYKIGNPGRSLNQECPQAYPNCWTDPVRKYDALELTVEKRLGQGWALLGSYRWSRLFGNYEGLFRNDNGQSDPNITASFDFPNNTPLLETTGTAGVLPNDRTHVVTAAASYTAPFRLTVGGVYRLVSGAPRTEMLAHPVYRTSSEVPVGARGNLGRTPTTQRIDLHLGYVVPLRVGIDAHVVLDIFNVVDAQVPTHFDDRVELTPENLNTDFGAVVGYQLPRTVRAGFKVVF